MGLGEDFSPEASNLHCVALSGEASVKGGVNTASSWERGKDNQMEDVRKALLGMLSSLLCLACQGLAARGHDDAESKLRIVMELRTNNIRELAS